MTTEQRLAAALAVANDYDVSPDLWNRVVYSIEEQRRHRRRLVATVGVIVVVLVVAIAAGAMSVGHMAGRARIGWRALEAIEFSVLVALVASLGPAIRRFGRSYVSDMFVTSPETGTRMLRLLDVAYFLLFSGYILVTTRFAAPTAFLSARIGDQIEDAAIRIGGLLLTMGVLHAVTLVAMPLVALVFNSTRARTKLPRWLNVGLVVIAVAVVLLVLNAALGLIGASA